MRLHLLPAVLLCVACSTGILDGDPTPAPVDDPALAAAEALYAPDRVVEIEITMEPGDLAAMSRETNTFFSLLEGEDCMDSPWGGAFNWYVADVRVDDRLVEQVGVRKKGLLGSLSETRPSLKVKFDKFVDGQLLDGLERLTLNNSISDPSLVRQCLGYGLFRDAGLPAPRCNFAHVVLNGEDLGIYVHVEPVKRTFLKWAYDGDSEGDLYEGTLSDFREGWTDTFEPETGTTDPLLGPVLDVADALALPGDAEMLDALGGVLDLDGFRRFWAMELLIAHWDGFSNNRNNFYVYRPPLTGKLEFLPWGIDGVMRPSRSGQGEPPVFGTTLLPRRLWGIAGEQDAYLDELGDLLDQVWDEDALVAEIDRMAALIEPFAYPDDRRVADQEGLRGFVRGRRAALESAIAGPLPTFDGPMPGTLCLVRQGDIRVDFETTWGTLGADNPIEEGFGALSGVYSGQIFQLEGGSVAGLDGENLMLAAQAFSSETTVAQVVLVAPAWAITQATIPLDGLFIRAYLFTYDFSTGEAVQSRLGTVWDGEIVFTALEGEPGGRVAGWFRGGLFTGGLF